MDVLIASHTRRLARCARALYNLQKEMNYPKVSDRIEVAKQIGLLMHQLFFMTSINGIHYWICFFDLYDTFHYIMQFEM